MSPAIFHFVSDLNIVTVDCAWARCRLKHIEMHKRLASLHHSIRKKRTRRPCPTCGSNFAPSHYEQHVASCTARSSLTDSEESGSDDYAPSDLPQTSDQSDEETNVEEQLHFRIAQQLRKTIHEGDFSEVISEGTDIFEGVTEDDVDQDLDECVEQQQNIPDDNRSLSISIVLFICWFLCVLQTNYRLTDGVVSLILAFLKSLFSVISQECALAATVATIIPGSLYMLWKHLNFKKDNFRRYVVCPKCYSLYEYADCVINIEGTPSSRTCSHVEYPDHPQRARRRPCKELLLKEVLLPNGKTKLYPFKIYCYKSVIDRFRSLLKRDGFENLCNDWKTRVPIDGTLADIYDGRVWKEFQTEAYDYFLRGNHNYALMLNMDWFQPFDHTTYSVGVIYAVVLNLPRHHRFKLENVLVIGIIPDFGKEPRSVASFLCPLVDELQIAWTDGFKAKTALSELQEHVIKLAVLCAGCDIPASRKLSGFIGHSATLGCSKCLKQFPGGVGEKDYSGFDRSLWRPRTRADHLRRIQEVMKGKTQTERSNLESGNGVRYSPLVNLPYFDPVRMTIIDPMHNLFQGTAKTIIKVWTKKGIISDEKFQKLQKITDSVATPCNIGRIPRKISTSFGGFTADQWKNWTNIFGLLALRNTVDQPFYENFRHFALASRLLCSKVLSERDIDDFDGNIMKFCQGFEELCGPESVTPNMHLHGHLVECLRDYGPVYSFWLFSFERYNGHLGALPSNNRAVEVQFMRRFLRDSFVHAFEFPWASNFEHFWRVINILRPSADMDERHVDSASISNVLLKGDPNTSIIGQEWTDVNGFCKPKQMSKLVFSADDMVYLKRMYHRLYFTDICYTVSASVRRCNATSFSGETFGTVASRFARSSLVMANWCVEDGKIVSDDNHDIRPGIIEGIYIHNLIFQDDFKQHILLKIRWYQECPSVRHMFPSPIEIWPEELFEMSNEATFMPIQRVFCKFVYHADIVRGKRVICLIPLHKRIDIF